MAADERRQIVAALGRKPSIPKFDIHHRVTECTEKGECSHFREMPKTAALLIAFGEIQQMIDSVTW
jgi:hypothetical protein